MPNNVPFIYAEYFDVPRMIVLNYRGLQILLDSAFDESLDDYSRSYQVYVLQNLDLEQLKESHWLWDNLLDMVDSKLGEIAVGDVKFDITRRKEISTEALDALIDSIS